MIPEQNYRVQSCCLTCSSILRDGPNLYCNQGGDAPKKKGIRPSQYITMIKGWWKENKVKAMGVCDSFTSRDKPPVEPVEPLDPVVDEQPLNISVPHDAGSPPVEETPNV